MLGGEVCPCLCPESTEGSAGDLPGVSCRHPTVGLVSWLSDGEVIRTLEPWWAPCLDLVGLFLGSGLSSTSFC